MNNYNSYRGRSHTKKQNNNCKLPISSEEKKLREQKKRLAKLFASLKFHLKNNFTSVEISLHLIQRFKKGTYKSIYQHALKQNPTNGGKSSPLGRGFRGRQS